MKKLKIKPIKIPVILLLIIVFMCAYSKLQTNNHGAAKNKNQPIFKLKYRTLRFVDAG